jgi:hypothetical protein
MLPWNGQKRDRQPPRHAAVELQGSCHALLAPRLSRKGLFVKSLLRNRLSRCRYSMRRSATKSGEVQQAPGDRGRL